MRITKMWKGITLAAMVSVVGMATAQTQKPRETWVVPAKYQAMKNPVKTDDAAKVKLGKTIYAQQCKSCHGNFGAGDGPKAKNMKTVMIDFGSAEFQKQSDGTLYFQSIIGRGEMENYESKIPDEEDRWAVIAYLRTLKK